MFSKFLLTSALAAIVHSLPTDLQVRQTFNDTGLSYRNDRYTVTRDSPAWSSVQVADGQTCTSNSQPYPAGGYMCGLTYTKNEAYVFWCEDDLCYQQLRYRWGCSKE